MNILDNILPVLRVAQAAAAGNPVPGLEGAITGVVPLAEMVSVCISVSVRTSILSKDTLDRR
jgi:hypothetical protein